MTVVRVIGAWLLAVVASVASVRDRRDRGDVPGWVMVTVVTRPSFHPAARRYGAQPRGRHPN